MVSKKTRIHQGRFDKNSEEINKLLKEYCSAFIEWQNEADITIREKPLQIPEGQSPEGTLRKKTGKADEVQQFANSNNFKDFSNSFRSLCGPSYLNTTPLLSFDGINLLKVKESIIEQWREHFSNLLNRPSDVAPVVLDVILQKAIKGDHDLPPTLGEVKKAIKQTSISKTSGIDGLTAEVFKAAASETLNTFHSILTSMWEEEIMPNDL